MNKPASKLIMPKHIWDGKKKEKQKKDIEKVPQPTGYRLVLFPLKLEGKTAGGVLLTDAAIEGKTDFSSSIAKYKPSPSPSIKRPPISVEEYNCKSEADKSP